MRTRKAIILLASAFLLILPVRVTASLMQTPFERLTELNDELSGQIRELEKHLDELEHPDGWTDQQLWSFNQRASGASSRIDLLVRQMDPLLIAVESDLADRGASAAILERSRAFRTDFQLRMGELSRLARALERQASRISPRRGEGVLPMSEAKRERSARQEVARELASLRKFLSEQKPAIQPETPLPPWKNRFMREREPRIEGKSVTPAYAAAPPATLESAGLADAPATPSARMVTAADATGAAAATAVGPSDTVQTVDTEPNQKIRDLVASLQEDPIRIYEWVLNNIAYQPYYGSAKGAVKTLYDRAGNDFDTVSLLISLFREAGIPARYVYGVVSLTAAQANNLFGTDSAVTAAAILAKGGTPARWDGFNLLIEHCWMEGWVPYDSYRGTQSLAGGAAWVPLDPSLKIHDFTPGLQVAKDVPMDWKGFFQNGVTKKTATEFWKEQIAAYIAEHHPGKSIEDVPIQRAIRAEQLQALPLSLRVEVREVHWEASEINDDLRHKIQFKYFEVAAEDWNTPTELDVTLPLSHVLSRRITLGWIPATPEDEQIIDRFGGLYRTPAYLVKVKAAVLLEGAVMDAGQPVAVGSSGHIREYAILPSGVQGDTDEFGHTYQIVKKQVYCPNIYGLGFGFQGYAEEYVQERLAKLRANRDSADYDDIYGEIAYINAITWYQRVNYSDTEATALRHVTNYPNMVSMGFSLVGADIGHGGGMGMAISSSVKDLVFDMSILWTMFPLHLETVEEELSNIMGCTESQYEHRVFEDYYHIPAVSAVKLIQLAYEQGIPVHNSWIDPTSPPGIHMDGAVRVFNWVGRGAVDGGNYTIYGGLSGGMGGACIGVDFQQDATPAFAFGSDKLNFSTSLNMLTPGMPIMDDDLQAIEIRAAGTTTPKIKRYWDNTSGSYQRIPAGSSFIWHVISKPEPVSAYALELSGLDWPLLPPGPYEMVVTLKSPYYVSDASQGVVEFNVLKVDMITPAGNPVNAAVQSGEGQNEFTFSTASPGVLTMNLKAKVTPSGFANQIKDQCLFTVDAIAGSTLTWDAINPGGKPTVSGDNLLATVTFTGLPANNVAFGSKKASVFINERKHDEESYEVFFPRDATNHPGGVATDPNWFYYWGQVYVNANVNYVAAAGLGRTPGIVAWTYDVAPNKTLIEIGNVHPTKGRSYGVGEETSGIDRYVMTVIHEEKHVAQIAAADALLPTSGADSFRFGWSWKAPHNHWKKGNDGEWGIAGIDDDGNHVLDDASIVPPFEPGNGDDVSLDNVIWPYWPQSWPLPGGVYGIPHPIEGEAVKAADDAMNENDYAGKDWGHPGKNHKTLNKWDD